MSHLKYIILVSFLIIFGGCSTAISTDTATPTDGGIISYTGEISSDSPSFRMNGTLVNAQRGDPPAHDNVTLLLLSSNGAVLETRQIGTLNQKEKISIHSNTWPKYIIFSSPSFWKYDTIQVDYYIRTNGDYSVYTVESKGEFPVELPE